MARINNRLNNPFSNNNRTEPRTQGNIPFTSTIQVAQEHFQNIQQPAAIEEYTLAQLNRDLDAWQSAGNTEKAKERIRDCFNNKNAALDLSKLRLTSLPTCITKFNWLQSLNFSDNQFTIFPPEIGKLNQL